jgi:hypothetical protein
VLPRGAHRGGQQTQHRPAFGKWLRGQHSPNKPAADPPFHDRIHPGRLNRSTDYPGASGLEDLIERGGEAGIPAVQDELHLRPGILQVRL